MKKYWVLILIAGIAIIAVSAFEFMKRPGKGDAAPTFVLSSLNGENVSLGDFRGKPVLIHFWATWCGTCQEDFPNFVKFYEQYKSKGLVILSVSEDGNRADTVVKSFINTMKTDLPVLLDKDGSVANSYYSFGVPEDVLIDKNGIIVSRSEGPINWTSPKFLNKINSLIGNAVLPAKAGIQ